MCLSPRLENAVLWLRTNLKLQDTRLYERLAEVELLSFAHHDPHKCLAHVRMHRMETN